MSSLGLNLTAADTIVLLDSDYNPNADLQVTANPLSSILLKLDLTFTFGGLAFINFDMHRPSPGHTALARKTQCE